MSMGAQLLLGVVAAAGVAWGAWRAGALARSGAWAAFGVGALIFGLGGWWWACLLLVFFFSSSALSRLAVARKRVLGEKFAKGSRRDWAQVLANGGVAAALASWHAWHPHAAWAWSAFAGALAAVNADTWSTEIGVLSRRAPRHILSGKTVPRGTSGGVSLLGFAAALGGALLIGWCGGMHTLNWRTLWAVAVGGFGGALLDSVLGATVQAVYFCPRCEKETEHTPRHTCGALTHHLRGWRWMDNDVVNFLASVVGAFVAALLA